MAGRVRAAIAAPAPPSPLNAATIDLDARAVSRDPYPHYERLRDTGPVQFLVRHNAWLVLGYEDVQSVLTRPAIFSSQPYGNVDAVLLGADPPEHTAIRRIVSPLFAPKTIDRLIVFAAQRASSFLRHELDVVTGYALPLSEAVAAAFLGFDEGTIETIHVMEAESREFAPFANALDGLAGRSEIYAQLVADGIPDAEARSLVRLLWLASTKTTERTIAHAVQILLQHDDIRAAVGRDTALIPTFVDEVLRLHLPELIIRRVTTAAVPLGHVELPTGALVYLCLAAANRDPARFAEASMVRLDRGSVRHLSFGFGIHHCVGATLGRRVIETALRTLLVDAPHFRAAQPLDRIEYSSKLAEHAIDRLTIYTGIGS